MRGYESSKGIWDWNTASVRRRFERQRPDIPEVARHRSHKDRSRWCRGRVGVPHEPIPATWHRAERYRCKRCGKFLDFAKQTPHWLIPRGM